MECPIKDVSVDVWTPTGRVMSSEILAANAYHFQEIGFLWNPRDYLN